VYRQLDKRYSPSLEELRQILAMDCGLEAFKLPTLLKVVGDLDRIPVSDAGKPVKNKIREFYFHEEAIERGEVEAWTLEMKGRGVGDRPFDWDGKQR
jgi:hypothetical protein